MPDSSKAVVRKILTALFIIVVLIGFDQWTKKLAVEYLMNKPSIPLIKDVLELTYVENFGAAFGMMQGKHGFFTIIAICVTLFLLFAIAVIPLTKRYIPLMLSFVFIIAGALGNLVDRVLHTYVVDFIYFKLIDFPVFNVADIYISVSCAVLVLLVMFYYKDEELNFKFR
ncbi:MAG: signal peptidase II [Eubacteriales bacterium]|nr:signal peptidase II [Eubacteriales bacterium]